MRTTLTAALLIVSGGAFAAAAARSDGQPARGQVTVAIAPFDIVDVDSNARNIGAGLAKLVRVEMLKQRSLRPVLLDLPDDATLPLAAETAAAMGREAQADLVVMGTVLEADTSQSDKRASTGGLFGVGVGGSISRTSARVSLHVELVDVASGERTAAFEVEGSKTETGVGADLWTTIGSFDTGQSDWDSTAMGKAVREAAQRLTREVARRAAAAKR